MRSTPALLLTLLALAPAVALAHHGWSGYDSSKVLTLTGTIREAGYEHPHGFVKLEPTPASGTPWLRISRVLRVMLQTRRSAEEWPVVRVEFKRPPRCA
jgi:Family of unknown function (DUF6152)